MRKFIVHTRPIPGSSKRDTIAVIEVECELVSAVEDGSVLWLPKGEFKARILQPEFLWETGKDGKPTPPIYYSHAVYPGFGSAHIAATNMIREELERRERKHGVPFSQEEYEAKRADIQDIRLP